jgi:hypothetical protein
VEDHFKVYMVMFEYSSGTLSKADAKELLSGVDLSGWENYPEHNRVIIARILQEDEPPVAEEKPLAEPLVVDVAPEPVSEPEMPVSVVYEPVKAVDPTVRETPRQPWQPRPKADRQPQKAYEKYPKNNKK